MEAAALLLNRFLFLAFLLPSLAIGAAPGIGTHGGGRPGSGTGTHGEKPQASGTGTHGDDPHASGTGTHGGNHIKNRFLLARDFAQEVLDNVICQKVFTKVQCQRMSRKMKHSQLDWFQSDIACLKARVRGVEQCVTAKTTPELTSVILIDVNAATRTKISFKEAVVLLVHEVGHSIGLSDSLITDRRIALILPKNLMLQDRELQDLSWAREGAGSLAFCKSLRSALEKVFDAENVGDTGAYLIARELAQNIRTDHVDILDRVTVELSKPGAFEAVWRFRKHSNDSQNMDSILEPFRIQSAKTLIGGVVSDLDSRGLLQDATIPVDPTVDTNKYSVQLLWKDQSIEVKVCTYVIQDAQLENATRISACSIMPIENAAPTRQSRIYFSDNGGQAHFQVKGRMIDLAAPPAKEDVIMKQVGKTCEMQLKAQSLKQVRP